MFPCRLSLRPLLLAVALLGPAAAASAQQPVPWMEGPIIGWTNHFRQQHGKSRLQFNQRLAYAARLQAYIMAQREQMGHNVDGSTFVDRTKQAGYDYQYIGENVAYNEGYPDPAWKAFEGWMNSPSHWQNIQNPLFTEIGIGVYRSASGKFYLCQMFGTPRTTAVAPGYPLVSQPRFGPTLAEPPLATPSREAVNIAREASRMTVVAPVPPTPPQVSAPVLSTVVVPQVSVPGSVIPPQPVVQFPSPPAPPTISYQGTYPREMQPHNSFTMQPIFGRDHPEYYVHPWSEYPGW